MKKLFIILGLFLSIPMFAQDNLNQLDAKGEKHGQWIVKHKNGKIKYATFFVHGTPTGISLRYNTKGEKTSEMLL
jgi:hypothetical protein